MMYLQMLICYFLLCCSYSAALSIPVLVVTIPVDQSTGTLSECSAGRPGGTRTPNLRFWRPLLCQLSYWPFITASDQKADKPRGTPAFRRTTICLICLIQRSWQQRQHLPYDRLRVSRNADLLPSQSVLISSTFICTLSPGMTISTPSGKVTAPVTSVVRK